MFPFGHSAGHYKHNLESKQIRHTRKKIISFKSSTIYMYYNPPSGLNESRCKVGVHKNHARVVVAGTIHVQCKG